MIHLSTEQLERYREKALSAEEQLDLGDHLSVCDDCRSKVKKAIKLDVSAGSLQADFETTSLTHLTYEQFAACVEGKIEPVEREIIESHLTHCTQCSKEMVELKEISAELPSLTLLHTSGPREVNPNDAAAARSPRLFWERARTLWRLHSIRIPVQIAAAAAAIAIVVWAAGLSLRREIRELEARLIEARGKNEQLQQEYQIAKADTEDLQAQIRAANSSAKNGQDEPGIVLQDGPLRVTIDNQVEGLETIPPAYQQALRTAVETGQVKAPQMIAELARKAEVLMGSSSEGVPFALFSPVGTVIRTARPTFRWQAVAGATSYEVTVFDGDYNEIARSSSVTTASWTLTEPLERGRVFLWKVTATKDGKEIKSPVPPAPEARFKVLEKNTLDEISRVRNNHPDTHVLVGLLYAQAGLLDDAEREFQMLARNNPKSAIAQKLLRTARSLRRD